MIGASRPDGDKPRHLIDEAGVAYALTLNEAGEEAWIEVIQKMDAVYADLVHHQVELERKNAELEEAQQFIDGVLSAMTDVLVVSDRGRFLIKRRAPGHTRTGSHLSPDDLLVAIKVEFAEGMSAAEAAEVINATEAKIRAAVPIATRIYIEPAAIADRPPPPAAE